MNCEVCGQPATVAIADIQETEPVRDEKGQLWMNWEVTGQHHFCADHERRPLVCYRPDTPEKVQADISLAKFHAEAHAKAHAKAVHRR